MRVNMDSSVVADPRFKLLGKRLGITWREALGSCFLVWLACYERRSEAMVADELDIAAECDGFASGMVSVGLARPEANGEAYASHSAQAGAVNGSTRLIVHGVKARIAFLEKQRTKGKTGGKRSGKARQNKGVKSQAKREANGSRSAQAYSPAPALTLTPALTPAQKTEESASQSDGETPPPAATTSEPPPAKPKQPRTPPDHPLHRSIAVFCDSWQARYGEKYPFNAGKDAAAVKAMLAHLDGNESRFAAVVARYLADDDPFAVNARHSLGLLRSQFAKWLVEQPQGTANDRPRSGSTVRPSARIEFDPSRNGVKPVIVCGAETPAEAPAREGADGAA